MRRSRLIAPRSLPDVVASHVTPDIRKNLLVSDGTSYAWLTSRGAGSLYVWSLGMSAPRQISLGARYLVDLDTGAMARLPANTLYLTGGGYLIRSWDWHIARLHLGDLPDLIC